MGHTLEQWQTRVQALVRDAGTDLTSPQVTEVGIMPALNLFSIDRPRQVVVEQAGAGSAYLPLPSGWQSGFSSVVSIEYPARQNPPRMVDPQAYLLTRSPSDVTIEQLLLLESVPSATEYVRVVFTSSWPTPTSSAAVDQLDDTAYDAVCYLAAAFCLLHLAAETSRSRMGALPTNFVDGAQRTRDLRDMAKEYRGIYDRYLGRVNPADPGAGPGPVSRTLNYDPAWASLFHGRRR